MTRAEYLKQCLDMELTRCAIRGSDCRFAVRQDHETYCYYRDFTPRIMDMTECPDKERRLTRRERKQNLQ